jgi:phosphatidylinositol glycan class C protein
LRIAAPILQTLTSSFSDDTIYALVLVLSSLHLIFYDYNFIFSTEEVIFSGALSLNAAMFTAVLLASRMKEDVGMVVSLLLLAVICFALYPSFSRTIRHRSLSLYVMLTVIMWIVATLLLMKLDTTLFVVYQLVMFFIGFIFPLWLTKMQVYKKSLCGPWEEATVP